MSKKVLTVGDMKELLKHSEDEEPLYMKLTTSADVHGVHSKNIECTGASSSAGGRITILWFEPSET